MECRVQGFARCHECRQRQAPIGKTNALPLLDSSLVGQMTYPDTSFTISRTNAVRLLRCPLVRDMRDDWRGVVFCSSKLVN